MTNCPNCSAPLPEGHIKCEYCGTTFIDFTSIDLKDHNPCYLRVKTNQGIITIKAFPTIASFEVSTDYTDIVNNNGYTVQKIANGKSAHLSMEFNCVYFKVPQTNDYTLYTVSQEDN